MFYRNSVDNIESIRHALLEFGFSESDLPIDAFLEPGSIIKFGIEPVSVDLLNEIDDVVFRDVFDRRERGKYGNVTVSFISKQDLINNKRASGRTQDKLDLENL